MELQIRNGLEPISYEDWEALWMENPAYKNRKRHWPMGWVLETSAGEIVGAIGNIPLAYEFQGRELLATSPCSWAVDATYRRHSLRIISCITRQKNVDLIVCTTVGPASEPIWRLLESRVPVGSWDQSGFWITNRVGFVKSYLRKQSVPLAGALSYPASGALFLRDAIVRPSSRLEERDPEPEFCSEFDSRFDEFWEELKREKHNTLLAVRSRETLAWHFRPALKRQKIQVLCASNKGRLVAYAIFDRLDRPDLGLKRVRLVDFQALNGFGDFLQTALSGMLRTCRASGVHVLEVVGGWLNRPGLPAIRPPHRRKLPAWSYYYKANDSNLRDALKDQGVWEPSAYDGDSSL